MIWRTLKFGLLALGFAFFVLQFTAPVFLFGVMKHDMVKAYEDAGVDVSDCKARKQTLLDPAGGMPECMQGAFKDIARRMNQAGAESDRRN